MTATAVKITWSPPGSRVILSNTIVGVGDADDLAADWAAANDATLIAVTAWASVDADDPPVTVD